LVLLSLVAVLAAQHFSKPPFAKPTEPQSYKLVRTEPLPASAVIQTVKFPEAQLAGSVPKVVEVATTGGGFRVIGDNELLALLADKPAVLIRTGPHSEELVFANPEDQKKLLIY
jgi:hypothetical protein